MQREGVVLEVSGSKLMALTEFTQNATVMLIPYPTRSDNSEGRKKRG